MRTIMPLAVVAAMLGAVTTSAIAQGSVMDDLLRDVEQVEEKLVSLAKAMPASTYDWRPMDGVRSVGDVFMHAAADNYFMPIAGGMEAPAGTGVKGGDYASVQAYEQREMDPAGIVVALQESFAHLKAAMKQTDQSAMGTEVSLFGMQMSTQRMWVLTVTHLHEHLGQAIAYARANEIVPPWSRRGM